CARRGCWCGTGPTSGCPGTSGSASAPPLRTRRCWRRWTRPSPPSAAPLPLSFPSPHPDHHLQRGRGKEEGPANPAMASARASPAQPFRWGGIGGVSEDPPEDSASLLLDDRDRPRLLPGGGGRGRVLLLGSAEGGQLLLGGSFQAGDALAQRGLLGRERGHLLLQPFHLPLGLVGAEAERLGLHAQRVGLAAEDLLPR